MHEIIPDHSTLEFKKDHIINKVYVTNGTEETRSTKYNVYLNIILKLASLLWILTTLYYIYQIASIDFYNLFHSRNENGREFNYYTASQFANHEYYGKKDLFDKLMSKMIKIIGMTETLSEKELFECLTTNKRNFLLYGPPGTGKTQFIKVLVKRLNAELCKKYKTKKDLVRAYFVTPSMVEDKYKGETERKIKALFDEARDDKDWKATFIFLDEIDAFFGHRTSSLDEHQTKSKTEFLNLLSGINDDLKKNIFVMGATNRFHEIDPAFKRRMGKPEAFNLPNHEEIIEMLKSITKSWYKSNDYEECIEFVADVLQDNYSQSEVTDLCSDVIFTYGIRNKKIYQKLKESAQAYVNDSTISNEKKNKNSKYN